MKKFLVRFCIGAPIVAGLLLVLSVINADQKSVDTRDQALAKLNADVDIYLDSISGRASATAAQIAAPYYQQLPGESFERTYADPIMVHCAPIDRVTRQKDELFSLSKEEQLVITNTRTPRPLIVNLAMAHQALEEFDSRFYFRWSGFDGVSPAQARAEYVQLQRNMNEAFLQAERFLQN